MANNELDIFNIGVNDIEMHRREKTQSDIYKPSALDGKDGVYKALVRFIPNINKATTPLIHKWVYWLTDMNGDGRLIDSPGTVNKEDPIAKLFFKLRKSESAVDRKNSEKLKRREQFYSLLQIIKDPQNPELEGTIKVFKFGYKIKQKIDEEMRPAFGEPTQIFDLFEGKNFELIITRQGDFNNYDSSKFGSSKLPITIDGVDMERNKENMDLIRTYLTDNTPDVTPFEYKEWDDETTLWVRNVLNQYVSPGEMLDNTTATPNGDASEILNSVPAPKKTTAKKDTATEGVESKENLDDFLNNLDI